MVCEKSPVSVWVSGKIQSARRLLQGHTKKGRPQATQYDIKRHAKRDQPTRRIHIHTRQRGHDRTSSQEQLARDKDIGRQGEADEDNVRQRAVPGVHNLQEGVASGRVLLHFTGGHGEHEDLDCCACSICGKGQGVD